MKLNLQFFILTIVCFIPVNLYAYKHGQDSIVVTGKNNNDTIISKSPQKTKKFSLDLSGKDMTNKIKKIFLDGKQVYDTDSINSKNIENISMKQIENGDIWIYIETKHSQKNNTNSKNSSVSQEIDQPENNGQKNEKTLPSV